MKKKIVRSINVMLMVVTILCCFSSMAILREAKKVEKPDYYIATDYGISTSNQNNSKAMQELINKVESDGGGTIYIPNGTYKFKSIGKMSWGIDYCIEAKPNVSIIGENIEKTILKQEDVSSLFVFLGESVDNYIHGCTYSNFTVDAYDAGDKNEVFGKAFYYQYVKNCVFRDIILKGTPATALGVDYLDQVIIDNITCIDCGRTYTGTENGSSGIGIGTGGWENENFSITNCICVGSGQFGIFIENQYNLGWGGNEEISKGCIISNCIVRNGLNCGIGIRGGQYVTITGCQSYENASDGIYIDGKCESVLISNNIIADNGGESINVNTDDITNLKLCNNK